MKLLNKNIIALSLLFIFGCASPDSIKINVDSDIRNSPTKTGSFQITTIDKRATQDIAVIRYTDKTKKSIHTSNSPSDVINSAIREGLSNSGHFNSADAKATINVELRRLNGKIDQGSVSYKAQLNAQIKVVIKHPKKTLTKQFKGQKKFKGAFTLNMDELEENMNELLSSLVDDIINDGEIHRLIAQ